MCSGPASSPIATEANMGLAPKFKYEMLEISGVLAIRILFSPVLSLPLLPRITSPNLKFDSAGR